MLTTKKSMKLIQVSIYVAGIALLLGMLFINGSLMGDINYSQTYYYEQAFGQNTVDQNSDNKSIHRQGLILSFKSGPNETAQVAPILPHREDGMLYSGVLIDCVLAKGLLIMRCLRVIDVSHKAAINKQNTQQ